jgi:hypothetical protein
MKTVSSGPVKLLLLLAALLTSAVFFPATPALAAVMAAGGDHNLVLKADGTIFAWGLNNFDQCQGPCVYLVPSLPHLMPLLLD